MFIFTKRQTVLHTAGAVTDCECVCAEHIPCKLLQAGTELFKINLLVNKFNKINGQRKKQNLLALRYLTLLPNYLKTFLQIDKYVDMYLKNQKYLDSYSPCTVYSFLSNSTLMVDTNTSRWVYLFEKGKPVYILQTCRSFVFILLTKPNWQWWLNYKV